MSEPQPSAMVDHALATDDKEARGCGLCVPTALEARKLTFIRNRQVVLRDVDVAVRAGEMVALLGPNGAGKTTLLHCLAGALCPAAGEVLWFGEAPAHSPAARRQLGFLGHESGLYLALTALENLLFAGRMYGLPEVSDRAAELLSAIGLRQHARQHVGCLSRGMRQRLAIARAVIHDPPILLLDEPFTSLDPPGRDWLRRFLCELRERNRAILIISHDAGQTQTWADRLLSLHAGRIHSIENTLDEQAGLGRAHGWRPSCRQAMH